MRLRSRRFHAPMLACAAVVTSSMVCMPSAHADTMITPYDRQILDTPQAANGWGQSGLYFPGQYLTDFCNRVGFGPAIEGKCELQSFYEEQRMSWTPDYLVRVSPLLAFNCDTDEDKNGDGLPDGSVMPASLGWSHTNTATNTVGVSISVARTVSFDVKPFGIGGGGSITTTVGAHYDYSWGSSSTKSDTYTINVRPGNVGWIDYGTFHGTAHGVAKVFIYNPAAGIKGEYKVVTDITGDLPKPEDPAAQAAQTVVDGVVGQQLPMTENEKNRICANRTGIITQPASDGAYPR